MFNVKFKVWAKSSNLNLKGEVQVLMQ